MQLRELYTDDRAVSPVVGVALLIAIAVILAAVIGAVVLGLGTGGMDTPQAQMQADFGDDNIEIEHNGGEPIPAEQTVLVIDGLDGNDNPATFEVGIDELDTYSDEGAEVTAGETIEISAEENEDGSSGTIQTDATEEDELDDESMEAVTIVWEDPNSDSETVLEEFEE